MLHSLAGKRQIPRQRGTALIHQATTAQPCWQQQQTPHLKK
jgi:hypothetical protein